MRKMKKRKVSLHNNTTQYSSKTCHRSIVIQQYQYQQLPSFLGQYTVNKKTKKTLYNSNSMPSPLYIPQMFCDI